MRGSVPLSGTVADTVDDLVRDLHAAFASRPYPGDDRIARLGPPGPSDEAEEVWRRYRGRNWRQMAVEGRGRNLRDDIPFLTFEGLAYYLPAFVELSLDRNCPFDVDEALASFLWTFPEEVASLLEPAQKRVVVRALEYLADEFDRRSYVRNDARAALEHYWAYFTDAELGL